MEIEHTPSVTPPSALDSAIHELRGLYSSSPGACSLDWKEQFVGEQRRLIRWATEFGILLPKQNAFNSKPFAKGEKHEVYPLKQKVAS
jgi:hypothetical protein